MAWKAVRKYYSLKLGCIGKNTKLHLTAKISGNTKKIYIGSSVLFYPNVTICCDSSSSHISIGNQTVINSYCIISTHGGKIKIGQKCNINPFTILYGHGGLLIGNNVLIAAHTVIIPANHVFEDKSIPIIEQGHLQRIVA